MDKCFVKTNTNTKQGILVHGFANYTFGIILIMFDSQSGIRPDANPLEDISPV